MLDKTMNVVRIQTEHTRLTWLLPPNLVKVRMLPKQRNDQSKDGQGRDLLRGRLVLLCEYLNQAACG